MAKLKGLNFGTSLDGGTSTPTSLTALLGEAMAMHQSGQLAQARQRYAQILEQDPNHFDATYLLSVLAAQDNEFRAAQVLAKRATELMPANADGWFSLGRAMAGMGEAEPARAAYRRCLQLDPQRADAQFNLGNLALNEGDWDEAARLYQQAVRRRPNYADAWINLAQAQRGSQQLLHAESSAQRAVQLAPESPICWLILGSILTDVGRPAEARRAIERTLILAPGFVDAHVALGDLAGAAEAPDHYRAALGLDPGHFDALVRLGRCLPPVDAIPLLERAARTGPAYNDLGRAYHQVGRAEDAVTAFRRAVAHAPHDPVPLENLGAVYLDQGEAEQARSTFRQIAEQHLSRAGANQMRAALAVPVILGHADEPLALRERIAEEILALDAPIGNPITDVGAMTFHLAYHGLNDRALLQSIHEAFRRTCPALSFQASDPGQASRIRVGICSAFLGEHTVGRFANGLVQGLNRDQFEVTIIRTAPMKDAVAARLDASVDRVLHVGTDLAEAQAAIANLGLDVLFYPELGIDATSFYLAFARLAPFQCTTWGHPVTTGISTIDAFVSSEWIEPADADYSERLVRLPALPTFYEHPGLAEPRDTYPGLKPGDRLYLCPQSLFKLHPDFDSVIAQILDRDPQARIGLLEGRLHRWTQRVKQRISAAGVPLSRVRFFPAMDRGTFLSLLARADVMLDPFPFGGGNTTYEALAQGTPIVTCPGAHMRGRVTLGAYRQMGLDDWIASSPSDYVERAVLAAGATGDVRSAIREHSEALFHDDRAVRGFSDLFADPVGSNALPLAA